MPITDRQAKTAKAEAKPIKLSDGQGLQLWIMPTGSKLWRLAYRHCGQQKTLALGKYPDVSIADARARRDEQRKILATGVDPSLIRKVSKDNSFNVIADEWLVRQKAEGRASATLEKNAWLLGFARPAIGGRPIADITAAEVLAVLRLFEDRNKLESGRRARAIMGAVFRFAISTARATNDPTVALSRAIKPPQVKHRSSIVDAMQFGELLRAVEGFQGQPTTTAALTLCALLVPRPGELRLSEWCEFDLDNAVWTVPAGRMKMRRPHQAPLSTQAVAVLKDLQAITGRGRLLFPSLRSRERAMSENTLNAALRRLGFAQDEMTAHGFRASFSTLANESGQWNADAIERHLAHVDENEVRRAYNHGAYWDERVKLSQWWADSIDKMRDGGKVLRFEVTAAA